RSRDGGRSAGSEVERNAAEGADCSECRTGRQNQGGVFSSECFVEDDRIVAGTDAAGRQYAGQAQKDDAGRAGGHQDLPNGFAAIGSGRKDRWGGQLRTTCVQGIKRTIAAASCTGGGGRSAGSDDDRFCGTCERSCEMTQTNGTQGSQVAVSIPENPPVLDFTPPGEITALRTAETPTRTKQRAREQIRHN